jgi:hypothetical protein
MKPQNSMKQYTLRSKISLKRSFIGISDRSKEVSSDQLKVMSTTLSNLNNNEKEQL